MNRLTVLKHVGGAALVVAGACLPILAQASALDQFKNFVASTQSAKGEFSQRLVKADKKAGNAANGAANNAGNGAAPNAGSSATSSGTGNNAGSTAANNAADGKVAGKLAVSSASTGTFQFARPGKFIWTYQKPYEQVLQADGDKLYIYDKELNQVTTRKLGNALGSSPAAILFGSNDLEKNFTLKDAGSRDGLEWLQAVPKAKDTTFDSIGIGMRDGMPAAMELRDSFGQMSLLSFVRFEKNPPLPANAFKFVLPKGADVLEQ
ncbi:MAG: lolA [Herminiimonas sp.]|nr:lolA [Herminiimonas sp.]